MRNRLKISILYNKINFKISKIQAPVVQTSDSAIHQINHYPADRVIDFRNTYPLDSDLSGGYHSLNNWGQILTNYINWIKRQLIKSNFQIPKL